MKSGEMRRYFVFFVAMVFVVNAMIVAWLSILNQRAVEITMSEPVILSTSQVCPGDILSYEYGLYVAGPATVDLSYTVVGDHHATSTSSVRQEQFAVTNPTTVRVRRQWFVPLSFPDALQTNPWVPGEYRILVQARETGRTRISASVIVPFELKADCENE